MVFFSQNQYKLFWKKIILDHRRYYLLTHHKNNYFFNEPILHSLLSKPKESQISKVKTCRSRRCIHTFLANNRYRRKKTKIKNKGISSCWFAFWRDALRDKRQAEALCGERKPSIMRSPSCIPSIFLFTSDIRQVRVVKTQ